MASAKTQEVIAPSDVSKMPANVSDSQPKEGTLVTAVKVTGEHKATFAKDNQTGKWMIRVVGPRANRFVGRIIPVLRTSGETVHEECGGVRWFGVDDGQVIKSDAGKPVCLYEHKAKPRHLDEDIPF